MTDVFEEVEESLRQDRATVLWRKYGGYLIGLVALIILGVAGWEAYRWQQDRAIEQTSRAYSEAQRAYKSGDLAGAKSRLETLARGESGFAVLANHTLADIEKDGDKVGLASAERLKRASEIDHGPLGRLALLKLAYAQADTLDRAALATLVEPLVGGGGNEAALAKELLAAKSLAEGDVEAARAAYQALSLDLDAPQNVKVRVSQALSTLPARSAAALPSEPASGVTTPETPLPATPAEPN